MTFINGGGGGVQRVNGPIPVFDSVNNFREEIPYFVICLSFKIKLRNHCTLKNVHINRIFGFYLLHEFLPVS